MSHISGALNSSTTILTVDFFQVWRPKTSEAEAVYFGRWAGAVLVVLGVIAAELLTSQSDRPVFLYLLSAYGIVTPGMATMFLVGIFWKRATQAGAITAGVLTIVLSGAIKLLSPTLPFYNRTGIVFWSCIVACVLVSLCTQPPSPDAVKGMIWNRASLRLPAEHQPRSRGWRNPVIWWGCLMAVLVSLYVRFA
jgi:SSS family solute:Na+ symporter